MIKSLTGSHETTGHFVGFWHSANGSADEIQQARLNAIKSAQRSIQFETFMMTPGRRVDDFADAIAPKPLKVSASKCWSISGERDRFLTITGNEANK